jgi:hypothetical protein
MRLITLGDSLTWGDHNWPKALSKKLDCELINFALPGAQNLLEIHFLKDWLIDNDFQSDDIVIWQIGYSKEPVVNVGLEHLEKIQRSNEISRATFAVDDHMIINYRLDNSQRITLFHMSPMIGKFVRRKEPIDDVEVLENLLFMFNIVKKLCPKILIIQGSVGINFVTEEHWNNIKKFLVQQRIDYLDDTIIGWCRDKNLPFLADNLHPAEEALSIFTNDVLYVKLKNLGWV